jgi:hypothetical protein
MLYTRYVHLTKAKHIHKRQAHHIARELCYTRTMTIRVNLKNYGREPQEAWCQDEVIGSKPPVVKLISYCREQTVGAMSHLEVSRQLARIGVFSTEAVKGIRIIEAVTKQRIR